MHPLADILAHAYANGAEGETVVTLHLFGIKYAREIEAHGSLLELVKSSGIPESYQTEIRKGMNLARYVEIKGNAPI